MQKSIRPTTPSSYRSLCRNWHLDIRVWLPGFIGPYPSTSLDKSLVAIQLRKSAIARKLSVV